MDPLQISNHVQTLDMGTISILANKYGPGCGPTRYIVKQSVFYVPFFGLVHWFLGDAFLKRKWEQDEVLACPLLPPGLTAAAAAMVGDSGLSRSLTHAPISGGVRKCCVTFRRTLSRCPTSGWCYSRRARVPRVAARWKPVKSLLTSTACPG